MKLDSKKENKIVRRGVLFLTKLCNINCEFCYYYDEKRTGQHKSLSEMIIALNKFRYYYKLDFVDITGGEPTIYPWIKELIKHCLRIGIKPTIITNGQFPFVVGELIDLGLDDVLLSIHGLPKTHNKIIGKKDAYQKIEELISLFKKRNFRFRTNTVITKYNLAELEGITEELIRFSPRICNFIIFNPHESTEWARKNAHFQVRYIEISPKLKKAIDKLLSVNIWVNVRYMPLCVMKGYEKHVCNFHQRQYDPYEWEYGSAYHLSHKRMEEEAKKHKNLYGEGIEKFYTFWTKRQTRCNTKKLRCFLCKNYKICDGIYPQYVKKFGFSEFKPVKGKKIKNPNFYRQPFYSQISRRK